MRMASAPPPKGHSLIVTQSDSAKRRTHKTNRDGEQKNDMMRGEKKVWGWGQDRGE